LIANQKKNASFRSTLEYVLGKESATLIDTNMGGRTPRQLAAEFSAARRFRPNFKRACAHVVLSIPHRDTDHSLGSYHEHLDDEQYVALAHCWLKQMEFRGEGLHDSQYLIARHVDTRHEHIHIIASRIRMDGSVVPDSWDYRRSEVVVRQLEKEFGLEATPCSNSQVANRVREEHGIEATVSDRCALTRRQKHHDSGLPPVTRMLADAIDEAASDYPTVTQLIGRLQHQGITVHPQFSTRGNFKEAIAFELNGVKVAGWKLGKAYSFPGLLSKRGVSYDLERDLLALAAAAGGELIESFESVMGQNGQSLQSVQQPSKFDTANSFETANSDINLTQQQHKREDFSGYKEGMASVPKPRQIKNDSIEYSRVELVLPFVEEFFGAVEDGQQRVGTNYILKRFGDTRSVFAKDGRGEVLRLTGQEVEIAALEDHDVMLMQQAWSRWLVSKQLQEQKKPKKCSSKRDQGLEL
jgi:Relaxase/Mobilisation nuclease domain